jgi:hypothetical protein
MIAVEAPTIVFDRPIPQPLFSRVHHQVDERTIRASAEIDQGGIK